MKDVADLITTFPPHVFTDNDKTIRLIDALRLHNPPYTAEAIISVVFDGATHRPPSPSRPALAPPPPAKKPKTEAATNSLLKYPGFSMTVLHKGVSLSLRPPLLHTYINKSKKKTSI